ncbi:MAG: hypothetical protein P9X26_06300 [Candidatus Stygibacter frigidus]|nr:hypothetical protein [Candidatus Stygibacter frigidus]
MSVVIVMLESGNETGQKKIHNPVKNPTFTGFSIVIFGEYDC